MPPYSFKKTVLKSLEQLGLLVASAGLAALGGALIDPSSVGIEIPKSEVGIMLTAVLAIVGRGLINWVKNRGK